mgnify:CR=1 FL=1
MADTIREFRRGQWRERRARPGELVECEEHGSRLCYIQRDVRAAVSWRRAGRVACGLLAAAGVLLVGRWAARRP